MTLLLLVLSITVQGQTTLISPTGDGGFENGATFAANGWTVENYTGTNTNAWYVGAVSPSAGRMLPLSQVIMGLLIPTTMLV